MLKMICISNTSVVEFHSNGKALYHDRTPITFNWLKPGTIYDVENMIGKVFIDTETNELIDAVILKDFLKIGLSKRGWLPANLFMRLQDWRELQLKKLCDE
jgi:hypothetical protein